MVTPKPQHHFLVEEAIKHGYTLRCIHPDEVDPDYHGTDPKAAIDALEACDEMYLILQKHATCIENALIISSLAPDETVADYTTGGFIDTLFSPSV